MSLCIINPYAFGGAAPSQFGALVRKSSAQSVTNVLESLTWETELYDEGNWHSTSSNTERMTVPAGVSLVRVTTNVTSGIVAPLIQHFKNGAAVRGGGKADTANSGNHYVNIASAPLAVSANDWFDTGAILDSSNNITSDEETWFAIEKLDAATKYSIVYNSASQSLAVNTFTILANNSETADTDGFHSNIASTVTITIASPGVVTWNSHGFLAGTPIVLTTTGALPTGLTAGTIYYVVSPAANTFQLAVAPGGTAINTSGSQSGTHTATNTSRLVVPSGVTLVRLSANVASGNVTGQFFATILKNGASARGMPSRDCDTGAEENVNIISAPVVVTTGDYFELQAFAQSATSVPSAEYVWFAIEEVPSTIRRALVHKSAGTQSFTQNVTGVVSWDAEVYDTDSMHDNVTNNSRLTVPAGCTKARVSFSLKASSGAARFSAWVFKNGSLDFYGMPVFSTNTGGTVNLSAMGAWVDVTPGDYFQVGMITDNAAGATLGTENDTWFCLECQ